MKFPVNPKYTIEITKKEIEKQLGYEINSFKIEPVYDGDSMIGLSIMVSPKKEVEFIEMKINIVPSGTDPNFN